MNTSQLRAKITISNASIKKSDFAQASRLKDKGYSHVAIGKIMGKNESSIRALLDPLAQERSNMTETTANMLRDCVNEKDLVDVGKRSRKTYWG